MGDLKLQKRERLSSRSDIQWLFKSNEAIKSFPVIFLYKKREVSDTEGVRALFTVSKRNFKKAVDRNRIKRLMRENFRALKSEFSDNQQFRTCDICITYTGKKLPTFDELEKAFKKALEIKS